MNYYITMTHDNVEEVVLTFHTDKLQNVKDDLIERYGELTFTDNESGSIKATPVKDEDVFYTIVPLNKKKKE